MELASDVLLVVAGLFLIGNAAVSFIAASWVQQVQENWWLGALANRWGAERVRFFLIANAVMSGLVGIAGLAMGAGTLL
jgi:hypothetical protein